MTFFLYFLVFAALLWAGAALGRINVWIAILLGLLLMAPFCEGMFEEYIHGRDKSVGSMFVPLVMFVTGVVAVAGAIMFFWGTSRLTPSHRKMLFAGLFIAVPLAGLVGFLWWSHSNIANVVASAESIAGEKPYCIDIPSGYTYKQATTLSDFSGATMRGPHAWGWYGGPHAILAVGSGTQPDTYHWSYGSNSFIQNDSLRLGPIYCLPRPHFARTMSEDQSVQRQMDEFRYSGIRFSIPSIYRVAASSGGSPSIDFYASAPDFIHVPESTQSGGQWSQVTVYLDDNDRPYVWGGGKIPKVDGEVYGLKKSTGRYANEYFNVSNDNRLSTRINCSNGKDPQSKYCMHTFRSGGWTYVFYHERTDLANWRVMQEKLIKLTRSFVKPSELTSR